MNWYGIVEDNLDPKFNGRCKVRVFGKFDNRIDINDPNSDFVILTEDLPWAQPGMLSGGGSDSGSTNFSVPKLFSIVRIKFENDNHYSPVYYDNVYPSDELKDEILNSYENAHVLVYDTAFGLNDDGENTREGEHIKIFFTEEKGLMLDYSTELGSSIINIKPDNNIEIINANGDIIEMKNDGNISFTHSASMTINLEKDIEINCVNSRIIASGEVHLDSPRIKLGESAAEAIVKGDTFKKIWDLHVHPTGVGLSGPPTTKIDSSLSSKNTTD